MKSILFAVALGLATPVAAQTSAETVPTRLVFEEIVTLEPTQVIGDTPLGRRQRMAISGGTFKGEKLSGRVLPGGADWQLVRADGTVSINAQYMIETDDKVQIHVHNVGIVRIPKDGGELYMWAVPTFEAPIGRYDWLNQAIFVSKVSPAGDKDHPAARITIYQVD